MIYTLFKRTQYEKGKWVIDFIFYGGVHTAITTEFQNDFRFCAIEGVRLMLVPLGVTEDITQFPLCRLNNGVTVNVSVPTVTVAKSDNTPKTEKEKPYILAELQERIIRTVSDKKRKANTRATSFIVKSVLRAPRKRISKSKTKKNNALTSAHFGLGDNMLRYLNEQMGVNTTDEPDW